MRRDLSSSAAVFRNAMAALRPVSTSSLAISRASSDVAQSGRPAVTFDGAPTRQRRNRSPNSTSKRVLANRVKCRPRALRAITRQDPRAAAAANSAND